MTTALLTQMSCLSLGTGQEVPRYEGLRAAGASNVVAFTAAQAPRAAFGRQPLRIHAARLAGVEIPPKKRIEFSLQYVYGIGPVTAKAILAETGVENKRTFDLTEDELTKLRDEIDKYKVEGDLRREIAFNIKRLKDIQCYRGRRHIANLPMRGQKTKSNARTRKGKVRATIANKKKA